MSEQGYKQPVSRVCSLHVDREDGTVYARLAGELDVAAEENLERIFEEIARDPASRCLIVDMRGVTFLDSSGLRILLVQEMRSRRGGIDFAVIPPRGQALQAMQLAGVHRLIELRTESGGPLSEAAKAGERASAGIGTDDEDPADWLSQPGPAPDEGGPTEII
jgi:anti-sigma B factor antagonist